MNQSEHDLCHKLLATHHLSIPERQALPGGRARFSVLVATVQRALEELSWFPFKLDVDRHIGQGAVIESRAGEIWVHEQHEVGVMRWSPVRSFLVADVAQAVHAYVEAHGGAPIDGVAIDWEG